MVYEANVRSTHNATIVSPPLPSSLPPSLYLSLSSPRRDCQLTPDELLKEAAKVVGPNFKEFHALSRKIREARSFKDGSCPKSQLTMKGTTVHGQAPDIKLPCDASLGARAVSQTVCMSLWATLEATNPLYHLIYNIITTVVNKCNVLRGSSKFNPAISLGVTLRYVQPLYATTHARTYTTTSHSYAQMVSTRSSSKTNKYVHEETKLFRWCALLYSYSYFSANA